jgi:nicotinamidase-related amidase
MDQYTTPDFRSIALITIDTQRDTLDGGALEIAGTSTVLPQMRRLLAIFRSLALPIVHVVRLYKPDGSNVDVCRRALVEGGAAILAPGSIGSELAPELLPHPDYRLDAKLLLSGGIQELGAAEVAIYKPRWGAFYGTSLEAHLRRLDVSTLAFTGCNYPNCPRTSIYEASERDFRLILVQDAVSGLYARGEAETRSIGVSLMSGDELGQALLAAGNKVSASAATGGVRDAC